MTPLELRDSLVRALTRPPRAGSVPAGYLVDLDDGGAILHLTARGRALILLSWPDGWNGREAVLERISRIAQSNPPRTTEMVVIGGGANADALVNSLRLGPRFHVHRLETDGALRGPRWAPKALQLAVRAAMADPAPRRLDASEVSQLRTDFRRVAVAEQQFIQAIQGKRPVATIGLIVACAAIFLLQKRWGMSDFAVVRMGATDGRLVRAGEWWRVVSGAFLHGGWVHIGMNMWALWVLGKFLEPLFGAPRLLVLYTVSAAVGGTLSVVVHPHDLSVGASGAIFGLLGALAALSFGPSTLLPPSIRASLRRTLAWVILLNVGISLLPEVDAFAHLGGGVAGLLLVQSGMLVKGLAPQRAARSGLGWQAAAFVSVLALAAPVAEAFVHGRPWELVGTPTLVQRPVPETTFSIGLPAEVLLAHVGRSGPVQGIVFGDLASGEDPLAVEVEVEPSTGVISHRDWAELARADTGARIVAPPLEEVLGGVETIVSNEVFPNGIRALRAASYRAEHHVLVSVLTAPDLPPSWSGIGRRIVASVRQRGTRAPGPK